MNWNFLSKFKINLCPPRTRYIVQCPAHLHACLTVGADCPQVPPARFTMTGRLQMSQVPNNYHTMEPLDFSVAIPRSPQPLQPILPAPVKHEDAVDLTMRGRSGGEESSCSSVASDIKPPSPYVHEPMPPAFPSVFKKSPSMTRPFKAYPKDPMNLPIGLMGGMGSAESLLSQASNEAYVEFRRQMLAQVVAAKTRRSPESSPMMGHEQHMMGQQSSVTQPEEAGSPQHPSSSNTDPSGKCRQR